MPRCAELGAAEEVAAADDDGDLDAVAHDLGDLRGRRRCTTSGSTPRPPPPANASPESLSSTRSTRRPARRPRCRACPPASGWPPRGRSRGRALQCSVHDGGLRSTGRTESARRPGSIVPLRRRPRSGRSGSPCARSSRTALTDFLLSSTTDSCSSRTTSLKKPLTRPSTIFGRAASGLPSSRAVASAMRRSFSTTSAGTSSRVRYCGRIAAICWRRRGRRPRRPRRPRARRPAAGRSAARLCRYVGDRRRRRTATRPSSIFSPMMAASVVDGLGDGLAVELGGGERVDGRP